MFILKENLSLGLIIAFCLEVEVGLVLIVIELFIFALFFIW